VKVEFKRRIKALKANELINQSRPLFTSKVLSREAGYEHDEVSNRAQYIEKHLAPPLISSNNRYAGVAVHFFLQRCGLWREGRLKDCDFRVWDGFGAGCDVCNKGMENVLGQPVMTE
jgi:hypothetical protein